MIAELEGAIDRAASFMLAEAAGGFPGARHEMVFPRWAGFRSGGERQISDAFARAVIADALLDVAEHEEGERGARWVKIARREADYVAGARLRDRLGGWSYFPDLPELPPDLDSLSAATLLFARAARQHSPLCEGPIDLALDGLRPDGSVGTWIVAPGDGWAQSRLMKRGIRWFWGDGADVEVCARFFLALHLLEPVRYAGAIRGGTSFVVAQQQDRGTWNATWYWGEAYGTALCLRFLRQVGAQSGAVDRAAEAIWALQREDGGWGLWQSVPLDTAVAMEAVADSDAAGLEDRLRRAVRVLLDYQYPEGSWPATPWIKMDVGRAAGVVVRTLTHGNDTVTTAFALRALCRVRRRLFG